MTRMLRLALVSASAALLGAGALAGPAASAAPPRVQAFTPGTVDGTLPDGAAYRLQTPPNWNGTVLLWSHGYRMPGSANPAETAPAGTEAYLMSQGYALAGSGYASTGWAVQSAVPDQLATLDRFTSQVAAPTKVIAWGASLGGLITTSLLDAAPTRFAGAAPLCGVNDPVGAWNQALDAMFVVQQLLAPGAALPISGITSPTTGYATALQLLDASQKTAAGRARIALAAAMGGAPTWADPTVPMPGTFDYGVQEVSQYRSLRSNLIPFAYFARADLEARAGGAYSWNTGVDYSAELSASANAPQVRALYRTAGIDLPRDLKALEAGPRVAASTAAVDYLAANHQPTGSLKAPVLTLHTTGDGLVVPSQERAYAAVVARAGSSALLRQTYVQHAGHCNFTAGEIFTVLRSLEQRIGTGTWGDLSPATLNATAALFPGPAPAFLTWTPPAPNRLGCARPSGVPATCTA